VIVVDVEGEYGDGFSLERTVVPEVAEFGLKPGGLSDFRVAYPIG
jgi:hypothetical protein